MHPIRPQSKEGAATLWGSADEDVATDKRLSTHGRGLQDEERGRDTARMGDPTEARKCMSQAPCREPHHREQRILCRPHRAAGHALLGGRELLVDWWTLDHSTVLFPWPVVFTTGHRPHLPFPRAFLQGRGIATRHPRVRDSFPSLAPL